MEILTNGRDEALKGVLDHLSTLIAAADSIKHEDYNFHRYADHMIQVQELLGKLQSQQATIDLARLLLRIKTEVIEAQKIIDDYKSKTCLLRTVSCGSVVSKLNQSSKEIYAVLKLLPFAQINTALNIKETTDAIIQGVESLQLKLSTNYKAVLSSLDSYISENSGNQQQTSHSLFMISRSKGTASSSVCPLPILIEVQESEGERSDSDSYLQLPPSFFFFSCPLTGEILVDPVSVSCNHSFERKAIEEYFYAGQNLCPLCNKELSSSGKLELTSNFTLRNSILEWKKRDEQINAERNAKKKLIEAATKITLDNMEETNQALGDLHTLMMEIPSCVSAATESSCELISKLAKLLKNNSAENISTVLKCLLLIARFSDENKEMIGRRRVIKYLLKQSMMDPATDPTALAVLLDLSRNKSAAGKITGIPYSISIFISFLDHPSSTVAEMARTVLENLSIDISSTVMMAKFGYFTPFLERFNSQEISDEIRAQMAEKLSQIQLTETSARNLQNERFITHLTESLSCDFPPAKIASLNCIKHLIGFHEVKVSFLQNESAITALLSLITTNSTDEESKQKAAEILISLIQTTEPSHPGFQPLFSSDSVREVLHQIRTSAPEEQIWLLRLLSVMAQNSAAVGEFIVFDHGAVSYLFSAIILKQNRDLKMIALKLIYYIAGNHRIVIPLPSSPSKESIIHSLVTILSDRQVDEELSDAAMAAAAAGILVHLSPDDTSINEMLQRSAKLKSIRALIIHSSSPNLYMEDALGVLLRCVNQSRLEFHKKVCKLFRIDLIQILSTGSPLAKRRAAMILSHLSRTIARSSLASRSSPSSSFIGRLVYVRRSVREGDGCPVHGSSCSLQGLICLVMDKVVKPLIEMVKTMDFGSAEAALMTLDTLFDVGCDLNGAATAIVEGGGAAAILEVLERGELCVKEKAFGLFRKIYGHPGISKVEFGRFRGLVLNMVRKDDSLRVQAENLLKDLLV